MAAYRTELDGLRALAAVGVVLFHVQGEVGASPRTTVLVGLVMGPLFVTFFAISGFVLYRGWARAHLAPEEAARGTVEPGAADRRFARYFWRRALRIYPVYWIAVTVAMAVAHDGHRPPVPDIVQVYLLLPFPNPQAIFGLGLRLVVWTLIADVAFYLYVVAHGLVVDRLVRRPGRRWSPFAIETSVLGALALGALVASLVVPGPIALATCAFGGMWFAVLEADEEVAGRRRWQVGAVVRAWPLWLAFFLALTPPMVLAAVQTLSNGGQMATEPGFHILLSLAGLALVSNLIGGPPHWALARALRHPFLRLLGQLSYGTYLWHPVVLVIVLRRWPEGGLAETFVAVLCCSLVLASSTFVLVERPLERRRRGSSTRRAWRRDPEARSMAGTTRHPRRQQVGPGEPQGQLRTTGGPMARPKVVRVEDRPRAREA